MPASRTARSPSAEAARTAFPSDSDSASLSAPPEPTESICPIRASISDYGRDDLSGRWSRSSSGNRDARFRQSPHCQGPPTLAVPGIASFNDLAGSCPSLRDPFIAWAIVRLGRRSFAATALAFISSACRTPRPVSALRAARKRARIGRSPSRVKPNGGRSRPGSEEKRTSMSNGGHSCHDRRTGWLRAVSRRECLTGPRVAIGGFFLDVVVTE